MATADRWLARLSRQITRDDYAILQTIADNATAALILKNSEGRPVFMNPAAEELIGYRLDEIRDRSLHEVVHLSQPNGAPYPVEDCPIDRAVARREAVRDIEEMFRRKDGRFVPVLCSVTPLWREDVFVGSMIEAIDITARRQTEEKLRAQTRLLEAVTAINMELAAELDLDRLVQAVSDAGTELLGAEFGAFFYNVLDEKGERYTLYTVSGVPRERFSRFPTPNNTPLFDPTFRGESMVRLGDVTKDPRYGQMGPHHGMPPGHLPVRSYLAVPVVSRAHEVLGGLYFGHSQPDMFGPEAEQIIAPIAAQAAVAIDNARLYRRAERELAERRRIEAQQRFLLAELNHRVKNTLSVVLAMANQTLRLSASREDFASAFRGRLHALSRTHTLLTESNWQVTRLDALVAQAIAPYQAGHEGQITAEGPVVALTPKQALALSMVLHELATNAAKYGALSTPHGRIAILWRLDEEDGMVSLRWSESGGPEVAPPRHTGFGRTMIGRSVEYELQGGAELSFEPAGLRCVLDFPLRPEEGAEPMLDPEEA